MTNIFFIYFSLNRDVEGLNVFGYYILFKLAQKKTWTIYIVYVILVSANTSNLKRVNAHAQRRELSTSVLDYV